MKQQSNSEAKVLDVVTKLQEQLNDLNKKVDILMGRMMATPALMANAPKPQPPAQTHHQPREKVQYNIICADCGKESTLPFKPNNDRPVYCKECFGLRRRNVPSANSGPIKAESGYSNIAPTLAPVKAPVKTAVKAPEATTKKKTTAKKAVAKKKPVTKKKK